MASYIIVRSDEYLAHHGIKNQKWGRRRWQNEDGSLTPAGYEHYGVEQGGNKKLDRLYKRETKRMQKLADRTDVDKQAANVKKYTKRALISAGVGAVGAGVAVGSKELNNHLAKIASAAMKAKIDESDSARIASEKLVNKIWSSDKSAHNAQGKFVGYSDETWNKVYKELDNYNQLDDKLMSERRQIKDNFNRGAKIRQAVSTAGWVVAAAGAGMSAYNAVQAGLAKRRTSELGHDKAVKKAEAQVARMQKMFANTPYAELVKDAGKSIKHSDELHHWGIKGQKWGVRRFQNADGTLTPEGKARYGRESSNKTLRNLYAKEYERGVCNGKYDDDPELKELYIMDREEKQTERSRDLVGESTYIESEYLSSARNLAYDKGIRRQILRAINSSTNPQVREAKNAANEWKKLNDEFDESYYKFSDRLRKDRGGKEWDGDGTEEHKEMIDRYPEYKQLFHQEEKAQKKLVDLSIQLAKSKDFSKITAFKNSKNFYEAYPEEYGDWYKKGDQRAYPIAMTLLAGTDTKSSFLLFPEVFIESFDKQGNKFNSVYFDTGD